MKMLLTVTAALVAAVFLAGPAAAGKNGVALEGGVSAMVVVDKAEAFSAEGIKKAEAKFDGIHFKVRTHLTVATVKEIPAGKKADFDAIKADAKERSRFFTAWAKEMAKDRNETGVFVLAYTTDKNYFVVVVTDKESDVYRHFTDKDAEDASKKLQDGLKNALGQTGADAQVSRDAALLNMTDFVISQLKDTTVPEAKKPGEVKKAAGGLSVLQWVLVIGGGLLVMWLVIGIIRALTGGGGGGGGGYGGGGGGGGGFMSSLMGGMFGAMAGMYLYNNVFGGGMSSASAGDSYGGGDTGGGYDTGAGDFDGGAAGGGGGGDWGGGGGDAGGGDWGGGGDVGGGGGDFGGGGGDW